MTPDAAAPRPEDRVERIRELWGGRDPSEHRAPQLIRDVQLLLAELAERDAALARLREVLAAMPTPVYYDTHGWFCCSLCWATSIAKTVELADPKPGHPVGYIAASDDPFPHKAECYCLRVLALAPHAAPTSQGPKE